MTAGETDVGGGGPGAVSPRQDRRSGTPSGEQNQVGLASKTCFSREKYNDVFFSFFFDDRGGSDQREGVWTDSAER